MRTFLRSALVAAGIAAIYFIGSGARDFIAPVADGSAAPEFAGIDQWLNSPPLSLKALRGKVVLVDFWTYSCINCINTLPYVKQWHEKYKDQGLVIVGVHTPEYPFEKSTANVQTALKRFDIRYPVALDNSYATWSAFHNQYWPATYLIDAEGHIVYQHFGEGRYSETEAAIRKLLTERK
jgi:thiol-disulfide isomerase/thioredoxin